MLLKNICVSLLLGLAYLFIAIYIVIPINYWQTSFLSLLSLILFPLPILLVIVNFSFWFAIIAFIPIACLVFFDLSYAFTINLFLTIPLLIVFNIVNFLKPKYLGKYIPIAIIVYYILLFLGINYYLNLHNYYLPNIFINHINEVVDLLKNINPEWANNYKYNYIINMLAFIIPTIIVLFIYLIIISNYTLANWLINTNSYKLNKLQIGNNLPTFYIYFFSLYLIILLGIHYTMNVGNNTLYILYNIACMIFIPFSVSGMGVINKLILNNKLFLFLFVMLILFTNIYVILILCLIGFLKEVKEIVNYNNLKSER